MSLELRAAEESDAAAVAAVHARSWGRAYRDHLPEPYRLPWPGQDREERWHELIVSAPPRFATTVAVDGPVLGFCSTLTPAGDDRSAAAEVAAIYVDPDHWRSGIGAVLIEYALATLTATGNRRVTAWLFAGNEGALAFYERFGFRPDGTSKTHPSGLSELRLVREA